ncbi:MAG: TolC family protein [Myxococcota bacterium]
MRAFRRFAPLLTGWLLASVAFVPVVSGQADPDPEPEPPRELPPVPPPEEVPGAEDPDLSAAGVQLDELRTPGGLTAEEAARRAVATAPSIEQARAAVVAAEAGAGRAWLGVLPRAELLASYNRLSPIDQPTLGQGDVDLSGVDDPEVRQILAGLTQFEFPVVLNQYLFRASVSYPVTDLFLTVLPRYRAARTAQQAQEASVRAREAAVALDAREAFYAYARARGALEVARASLEQAEAQAEQVGNLVDAGAAARVEGLRARARVASARVALARARGGVAVAERSLRTLLHLPADASIAIGEDLSTLPAPVEGDVEALVTRAKDARPEVESLELLVRAREREARAEAGRQWPQLSLQGQVDYANPNQRIIPLVEEFRTTWQVGAALTWSPNAMLDARAGAAETRAEAMRAEADLRALEDSIEVEVVRSHDQLETAREALEAAQLGIEAAEESYRVRFRQLEAGAAVTTDLVDADAELTRARLELLDAAIDVHLAHARLRRAVTGEAL